MFVRLLTSLIIPALTLAACSGGVPVPPAQADAATSAEQQQAFVRALQPRHARKPVIAVLALNAGTEITDFMLSHAVL